MSSERIYRTYDDNIARLMEAHPALFRDRIPECWCDLSDGWYPLVDQLCTNIEQMLSAPLVEQFSVSQIKEKFGGLRFYWKLGEREDLHVDLVSDDGRKHLVIDPADVARPPEIEQARERVRHVVDAACEASEKVCARCGAPGELGRTGGWVSTFCAEHRREAEARAAKRKAENDDGDEDGGW